jgi:hypothetical protein
MKKVTLIIAILFFANGAFAQKNTSDMALGIKWAPSGVTFKKSLKNSNAYELLGYFWKGSRFTGLYEIHKKIEGVNGLRWYYGPGVHVSFYDKGSYNGSNNLGVDGVLGLDLTFDGFPINLSLDWQPSFDFGEGAGFVSGFGGLSIRYFIK